MNEIIENLVMDMKFHAWKYMEFLEKNKPKEENLAMEKTWSIANEIIKLGGIKNIVAMLKSDDVALKQSAAAYLFVNHDEYKDISIRALEELLKSSSLGARMQGVCNMYLTIGR